MSPHSDREQGTEGVGSGLRAQPTSIPMVAQWKGSDDAWGQTDPWFGNDWSMQRYRRQAGGVLLLIGVFAAGILTHSAWTRMQNVGSSGVQSAGMLELSDPEVVRIAGYVRQSYSPTSDSGVIADRVAFAQSQFAEQTAKEWLGSLPMVVPAGTPLVQLESVARSHMPGGGRSVHYRYTVSRKDSPETTRTVSIFVQQDDDRLKMLDEGKTYLLISGDTPLRIWRKNGLVYFLLGESRWANMALTTAMGVPDASEGLRLNSKNLEIITDPPKEKQD